MDTLRTFTPDWSLLEATQDSLREHMAMIRRSRAMDAKTTTFVEDVTEMLEQAREELLTDLMAREVMDGDSRYVLARMSVAFTERIEAGRALLKGK